MHIPRGPVLLAILASLAVAPAAAQTKAAAPRDPGVLAEVDGVPITADEVATSLGAALSQLEQRMYELREQRLEALIADRLLAKEAAKRGVTVPALVEREVAAKTPPVTDAEVEAVYTANKERIGAPLADARDRIKAYLHGQKQAARRHAFVETLKASAKVVVYLKPPTAFRARVTLGDAPVKGAATAPVTIVEFSDFYCPYCRRVRPVLAQVRARYGDKIRFAFKNLPLENLHPGATRAAEAGLCANEQGKFWEYHDKLFAAAPDASAEQLETWAGQIGLDKARFAECLGSGRQKAAVQRDIEQATSLGANGTPAFFINGLALSGAQPFEAFARLIDQELARPH